MNVTVDFLITCVGLSNKEIFSLVKKSNIRGNVIVGNQKMPKNSVFKCQDADTKITIINQNSIGTSKNRNKMLEFAKSDFVIFWDDDSIMYDDWESNLFNILAKHKKENAIRFNNISDNPNRPIKQLSKNGYYNFMKLRSFGVCGIFFSREYILKNKIMFDENIGPGTKINHGEDSVFLKNFLDKSKYIYAVKVPLFHILQEDSCWFADLRENYWFSQGYLYKKLFNKFALICGLVNMIKNKNDKLSFKNKLRYFKKGLNYLPN